MNKKHYRHYFIILLLVCLSLPLSGAEKTARGNKIVHKVTGSPVRTFMDINNISTVLKYNGDADIDVQELNSGFVFPKGSNKACVFETGFLWGGLVNGEVRVNGSSYGSGLQSGRILPDGTAEDPEGENARIYRVRPDYKTATLNAQAANEGVDAGTLYDQFEKDWNEWPAASGAPYVDVNNNGSYDPDVDIPGVAGADMTIWFVANDLDVSLSTSLYGATPIGIEMQVTVWAYSQQGALGNMIFKKYLVINKGQNRVDSMYVSQWSDIDDGNSTDDFAGCDTTLSLGYCYNANPVDATYDPLPPPAVGFDFFQGPAVNGSPTDVAIIRGQKVSGKKNLPMTAFYYFARGDANVTDPTLGSAEGSSQFYNFFRGRVGKSGQMFVDPNTSIATPFALAGDPQTRKGWVDGQVLPSGDRRIGLASGPFTMVPGDTQEVVVAEIAAGATPGVDRLSAIGLLKFYDKQAQLAYDNFFDLPTPPPAPVVTATALDKEILINWGTDLAAIKATETSNSKGYAFEGYNVYQLPSASATISQSKRLATFDIVDGIGKIQDYFFDASVGDVLITDKQFGPDAGIKRFLNVTVDELGGGGRFINGKRYYFAVTAYNYNSDPAAIPNNLETPLVIFTVVPHSFDPGVRYSTPPNAVFSDVTHSSGSVDPTVTTVSYRVIDPTKLTGANYSIGFYPDPDNFKAAYVPDVPPLTTGLVRMIGNIHLSMEDTSITYSVKITSPDSLSGGSFTAVAFQDAANADAVVKDIAPFVYSVEVGKKVGKASGSWKLSDTTQKLTAAIVQHLIAGQIYVNVKTAAYPAGEIQASFNYTSYPWYLKRGNEILLPYQQNYSKDSSFLIADGIQPLVNGFLPITYLSTEQTAPAGGENLVFYADGLDLYGNPTGRARENFLSNDDATTIEDLTQDIEFRFTGVPAPQPDPNDDTYDPNDTIIVSGGSIATIVSYTEPTAVRRVRIPFEVWEVQRNRQINVAILERDRDENSPWGESGTPQWYRMKGRDEIVPIATPYNGDTSQAVTKYINLTSQKSTWLVMFHRTASTWNTGDKFVIRYGKVLVPGVTANSDVFSFSAPASPSFNRSLATEEVKMINVFPNPYYGVNTQELNRYERFVTFNHLPVRATIRIFNIAGILVRTLEKNDASTQFQRWDLTNESSLPVASGLYIAYIDMPDLGTTKILKFSIIQERQILDRF